MIYRRKWQKSIMLGLAIMLVLGTVFPYITDPSYAAFTGKKGSKYTVWDGGQITYGSGNGGYSNSRKCDLDDDLGVRYSYCVQPSKASPGTGTVTVDKVITDDNDTGKWNALRNVVYYSPSYPGYAITLIRGVRPMKDLKYDLMKHPFIKWTADGGYDEYVHGQAPDARLSIWVERTCPDAAEEEAADPASDADTKETGFVLLSEEDIANEYDKKEKQKNEKHIA